MGKFDLDSIFFCSISFVFSTIALLFFRPSKTLSREENLRPYNFYDVCLHLEDDLVIIPPLTAISNPIKKNSINSLRISPSFRYFISLKLGIT